MPEARLSERLRFSDRLFVGVFALACMLAISTPLFGFSAHHTVLNHFPLILLTPVLALHLLGLQLNRAALPWAQIFKLFWPLLLLGLFALTGSAMAKWGLQITETYLAFGIYILLLPLYASLATNPRLSVSWAQTLLGIWVLTSVAALVGESARYGSRDTLHEIEYLVALGFFALYHVARSWFIKLLAVSMMVGAVALNQKITGFLVTALALLHMIVTFGGPGVRKTWRPVYFVSALSLLAATIAGLAVLYFQYRHLLPSGNVEVRLAQYEQAWRAFLVSPIWGFAYMRGSGEIFRQGLNALNIPTHSDVLDILKHGGLVALGLFLLGYWRVVVIIHRAVVITQQHRLLNAYFISARFFLITALLTFSVNPLLLKGPFLIVIWGNLGLAVGLALGVLKAESADAS